MFGEELAKAMDTSCVLLEGENAINDDQKLIEFLEKE